MAELGDQPARGFQRQEQQPQQRSLAGAGRTGEELEGMRLDAERAVLRDLTFRIEPHSFQFLPGPSGAGKTSLLRLLFLSLKPTRGLITQFGHDVAMLSRDAV